MNSQELKCFVVAADRLNFTRAAKELYVTPPTITHHIQHLEEELGVKLFIRDSKSVQLTTAGEMFYHDAHDILLRMEEIPNRLRDLKANEQRILKIGCTMGKDTEILKEILSKFRLKYPHVSPRIYLDDYFQLLNRLYENQLDMMIGTKNMLMEDHLCDFMKISTIKMKALIPQTINIKDSISLEDLSDITIITLRQKNLPKVKDDPIEHYLSIKRREKNVIRLDDERAILALVTSGYGIGILPEYAYSIENLDQSVQVVDIQESPMDDYGLIYLKNNKNSLIMHFIECI